MNIIFLRNSKRSQFLLEEKIILTKNFINYVRYHSMRKGNIMNSFHFTESNIHRYVRTYIHICLFLYILYNVPFPRNFVYCTVPHRTVFDFLQFLFYFIFFEYVNSLTTNAEIINTLYLIVYHLHYLCIYINVDVGRYLNLWVDTNDRRRIEFCHTNILWDRTNIG